MCDQCTPLSRAILLMSQSMQDQTKAIERQAVAIEQNTIAMQQLAESNIELVESMLAEDSQYGDEPIVQTLDGSRSKTLDTF